MEIKTCIMSLDGEYFFQLPENTHTLSLSLLFNVLHSGICLIFLDINLFSGDCVLRFHIYFCLLIAKCCMLSTFYGVV